MADLPQQNTIVQYVADGTSTNYVVPFYTPIEPGGKPDLDVFVQAPTAPPIPETDIVEWNVVYTYSPNLDPITGGVIIFNAEFIPANTYIITIVRNVSASLDVEFSQAQTFSGFTLDLALDKLLLISQQNKSYTLERNLSYIINSYLPESTISANVQIPVLLAGQIWYGSADGVIAATLEQSGDTSVLRSQLANEQPTTNGAAIVGYYDTVNLEPTTVAAQLTYLTESVVSPFPPGAIIDFGGTSTPTGFLLCDGSSYATATYADLFEIIGYTWGGSGANFNVPNLNRRVTMGAGGVGTAIIGNEVGNTCTGETTTLTDSNQIPSHTHNYTSTSAVSVNVVGGTNPINVISSQPAAATSATGGTLPFSIVQSAAIVLKIIKT